MIYKGGMAVLRYRNSSRNRFTRFLSMHPVCIPVTLSILWTLLILLLPACMRHMEHPVEQTEVKVHRASRTPKRFVPLDYYPEYLPFPKDGIYRDGALDTLWIMLNYRGLKVERGEFDRKFKPENREDFLELHDLKPIASSHGLSPFEVVIEDLETLKALVASKMPPIVAFRERADQSPYMARSPSFAVVTGYDDEKSLLFIDSPCFKSFSMPYSASYEKLCLVVLEAAATEDDLRKALARYISSEVEIKAPS